MADFTIGQVAARAGVSPEAIRYYERRRVLEPATRDASGHRRFDARTLDELQLLKAAQAVGFSLEEIARMLALTRQDPIECRPMCDLAEKRIAEMDARIRELAAARDRLTRAVQACDADDACTVADRLRIGAPD